MKEKCVLYDRDCINCGECEFCDLDPTKICDNCGKCLESVNMDYAAIKIDGISNADASCIDTDCDCGCGEKSHSHDGHNHNK